MNSGRPERQKDVPFHPQGKGRGSKIKRKEKLSQTAGKLKGGSCVCNISQKDCCKRSRATKRADYCSVMKSIDRKS